MAVVPLAIPVMIGPATIGAIMVYGAELKSVPEVAGGLLGLVSGLLILALLLHLSGRLETLLGKTGLRWHDGAPPALAGHPLPFPTASWGYLADGLGLWDEAALGRDWRFRGLAEGYPARLAAIRERVERYNASTITHEALITQLGGRWEIRGPTPDPEGLVNPDWRTRRA